MSKERNCSATITKGGVIFNEYEIRELRPDFYFSPKRVQLYGGRCYHNEMVSYKKIMDGYYKLLSILELLESSKNTESSWTVTLEGKVDVDCVQIIEAQFSGKVVTSLYLSEESVQELLNVFRVVGSELDSRNAKSLFGEKWFKATYIREMVLNDKEFFERMYTSFIGSGIQIVKRGKRI